VEERRFRVGSFFEWTVAALGVALIVWVLSVPLQRVLGPRVEATVDAPASLPPGIPAGSTAVPVMYLLDGRELRHGELHTRLVQTVPDRFLDGPIVRGQGEYGERHTRSYVVDGTRFFVFCERTDATGPFRIAGIYLP
jgi:hypothetical protein